LLATSTFFQLLLIRDRIVAARRNLENAEAIGRIAAARVDAGVSVPIDALQQQIQIEQQRTALQSLIQADLAARASLALLVGRHVQGFDIAGQTLQNVEVPRVQPGLPSELLVRRPDLYQAEMSLRGSAATVTIVRRSLFRNLADGERDIIELSSQTFCVARANLGWNHGEPRAAVQRQRRATSSSRNCRSRAVSRSTAAVLGAFNEVEVALSNIQLLEEQAEVAASSLGAAEESFRIAEVRYREGVADFETVLVSQNSLFSTRNAFLDNKLQRLNAILSFYQALGGGWTAGDIAEYWGVTAGR
jgi:outer membrane protein TolC